MYTRVFNFLLKQSYDSILSIIKHGTILPWRGVCAMLYSYPLAKVKYYNRVAMNMKFPFIRDVPKMLRH